MNTNPSEFAPIASPTTRTRRERLHRRDHSPRDRAATAAFDQIFANFADCPEQADRPHAFALDAQRIRDMTSELDRQRERLAKLLRDIDLSA